jgi:hypothetical protein
MPLEIHIITERLPTKTTAEQIDEAMAALGFVRDSQTTSFALSQLQGRLKEPLAGDGLDAERVKQTEPGPDTRGVMNVGLEHALDHAVEAQKAQHDAYVKTAENIMRMVERGPDPEYTHPSGRKFGQPGPGGKRRTKAEMAEDTAYLASLDKPGVTAEMVGRDEPFVEEVIEDPETDAQDAADEAAEAGEKSQGGPLNLEDLRRVIGEYAKKHGMAKAAANIPTIIEGPMLEVTDFARAIARVKLAAATSDGLLHEMSAEDLATCGRVVDGLIEARDQQLAKIREAISEKPSATKDELMAAVMAYAAKYEGKGVIPASGGPTAVDLADVMRKTFPGTSGALSEIPATPEGYGKALAAVSAATTGNPYSREAK